MDLKTIAKYMCTAGAAPAGQTEEPESDEEEAEDDEDEEESEEAGSSGEEAEAAANTARGGAQRGRKRGAEEAGISGRPAGVARFITLLLCLEGCLLSARRWFW